MEELTDDADEAFPNENGFEIVSNGNQYSFGFK
jgi:hypothetical protein